MRLPRIVNNKSEASSQAVGITPVASLAKLFLVNHQVSPSLV
jgi:hypothetical protein